MRRLAFLAGIALVVGAAPLSAQEWADKMFKERSHDFGAVPRAAKIEHEFVLTNLYKEDIHIAGVRSSCGCTAPQITKEWLRSREKGTIVAKFNTRTFTGQRGARLTVTIDKPFYAEVELQVRGYIRTDVVLNPSQVNLGTVDQGEPAERTVTIDYAGRSDWRVLAAKSSSPYLKTSVREVNRDGGRITYKLNVQLADDAPSGYLRDQLTLTTNDYRATRFPIMVEGRVVSSLAISPSSLMLGILQPGQKVTKKIVVTGRQPFRILDVECDNQAFEVSGASDEAKRAHVIEVTFTAGSKPGKIVEKVYIKTDSGEHAEQELPVYGQVTTPLAGT